MTTPTDRTHTAIQWELAGARQAGAVVGACAVLVTGRDATAAAHAAIGLGRVESARRRVAIGDLVGDVPPLVALVEADDPHGIVDSFLYGVSLNRVARPVSGADNLFVLPSGTEPVVTEEIFRSDRWRRLASGFREVGALLMLVAPADAPGLEVLAGMLDGVVRVGEDGDVPAFDVPLLATVAPGAPPAPGTPDSAIAGPLRPTVSVETAPDTASAGVGAARASRADRGGPRIIPPSATPPFVMPPGARRRRVLVPLLLLVALAAGGVAAWWLRGGSAPRTPAPPPADTAATTAAAPAPRDTLPISSLVPANPGDSATAAAYVIEVAKFSTEEGARESARQATRLVGATWYPLRLSNEPGVEWHRVTGGSWRTREGADSALAELKATSALMPTASVLRAPYSLLVGSGLGPDSLRARTARFAQADLPVYALRQADGTHALFAGAFETPDQSMFLALALQQMGVVPTLVYRTGRAP